MIRNRRAHRRVNAFISVILDNEGREQYVSTTNVSAGGAYISSGAPPELDDEIQLLFRGSRGRTDNIYLRALVVRIDDSTADVPGFGVAWTEASCAQGVGRLREFLSNVLNLRDMAVETDAAGSAFYVFPPLDALDAEDYEHVARQTAPLATEELRRAAERARADVEAARAARIQAGHEARPQRQSRDRDGSPNLALPTAAPLPKRETIPATAMAQHGVPLKRETIHDVGGPLPVSEQTTEPGRKRSDTQLADSPPAIAEDFDAGVRDAFDSTFADELQAAVDQLAKPPEPLTRAELAEAQRIALMETPNERIQTPSSVRASPPRRAASPPQWDSPARRKRDESPGFSAKTQEKSSIRKLLSATGRLLGIRPEEEKPRLGRFAVTDDGRFFKPGEEDNPTPNDK